MTRQPDGSYKYRGIVIFPEFFMTLDDMIWGWMIENPKADDDSFFRTLAAAKAHIDELEKKDD